MGRKKISIARLTDERNRQITFSKRRAGLLKKAYELSILCDVEIAVIMITGNSKLYQYASSNMNSILIRYTDFKDPEESKTNADILDDITKKEKGSLSQDDSGDEDPSVPTSFLLTPRTQENFRRMDKEFDHLLRNNQVTVPSNHPPASILGSAPPNIPSVMPVTIPVGVSPTSVQQQIQQHLLSQLENQKSAISSSGFSSSSIPSVPSTGTFSPQCELAPMTGGLGPRSPTSMPPPVNTPTRLQTLRSQTLKLHLPGSGRNYISLSTGGSGSSAVGEGKNNGGLDVEEDTEDGREEADDARPGTKPQLHVIIPGQKEFIPRTQDLSPMPQVAATTRPTTDEGGGGIAMGGAALAARIGPGEAISNSVSLAANTESLTTPVLSLTTPTVFSSLPPIFSSLLGDFPFNQTPISSMTSGKGGAGSSGAGGSAGGGCGSSGGGGGGSSRGGEKSSTALVAFPVSIQPSATSGTAGGMAGGGNSAGNLILQAQNMGQPFLLTPSFDSRQNPLFNSQSYATPTPSSLATTTGLSPNISGNLEQLKQQYERTQQLIQQRLFYTQMQMLQHHQNKEGGGGAVEGVAATGTGGGRGPLLSAMPPPSSRGGLEAVQPDRPENRLAGLSSSVSSSGSSHLHQVLVRTEGGGGGLVRSLPNFINGSDVMMSSHAVRKPRLIAEDDEGREEDCTLEPTTKKSRLDVSLSSTSQ